MMITSCVCVCACVCVRVRVCACALDSAVVEGDDPVVIVVKLNGVIKRIVEYALGDAVH